jgi:putative transposase
MTKTDPFKYSHSSPEIIRLAVMMYVDFHFHSAMSRTCCTSAVDHEGEMLEPFVTKQRDRKAALKFLKKSMKRHGRPHILVTDKLRSYGAAMKEIGNADKQETGRWLNNRAEKSHVPLRRLERAMKRFRSIQSLQKFVAVHASIDSHFNQERALYSRGNFKLNRGAALAEWRQLCSA